LKKKSIFVVLFFLILSLLQLSGEENEVAILVRGPVAARGFPEIYPNAIKTWEGYYRYLDSELVVFFTREDVLLPSGWVYYACGNLDGFLSNHKVLYYKNSEWSVLFSYLADNSNSGESSGNTPDKELCNFADKFIIRLKYFLRDADPLAAPLLPAVLEF
jgi:hypothetical protein